MSVKNEMHDMDDNSQEDEGCIVRVRGLPWSATQDDLVKFLEGCAIVGDSDGIHFTYVRDGRPSGEAYIELESEEDVEKALTRDRQHIGKRYVEVFRSKKSEMDWVVKRSGPNQPEAGDAVIRLRGLPFGCSKEEIAHFFSGMEIVPNGITLLTDNMGRTTGDAYVQFANPDIAEKALCKHKEKIGHRYIEIFKSSLAELRNPMTPRMRAPVAGMGGRPGPYDRGDRFGGSSGGGGMGMGGGGGMGYGRGGSRGRGNIKGYFDDGFGDDGSFGNGYGGSGYGRGGGGGMMGRRGGGMGGGMGLGGGGGGGMGGGMGSSGRFGSGSGMGGGGMGGGGGGGGLDSSNHMSQTGHSVHMRGLPFAAAEQDVLDFFQPLNPINVIIHFNDDGRASGKADVDFATHEEAKEAMKKHRASMQHRYIELFLKSTPGQSGGNSYGGGVGNRGSGRSFGSGYDGGSSYGLGNSSMGNSSYGMGSGMGMNDSYGSSGGNSSYGGGYGNSGSGFGSNSMGSGYGSGGGMGNSMGNPNYTAF